MNLDCLNDIITDGLGIHIDISDIDSWNLNSGFTSVSLSQWSGAKSDNLDLVDFGLTAYDNGRVDRMYDHLNLTPQELKLTLYRVGYNTGDTAFNGSTQYDLYPISAVTSASTVGNYFDIEGGYLQGFFKLSDYNYEVFPQRYNAGITIETLIRIDEDSSGIFFLMGARAEDKYNPAFSGESEITTTKKAYKVPSGENGKERIVVTDVTGYTGVQTSEGNYLNAYQTKEEIKEAFASWENNTEEVYELAPQSANTKSNVIAFALTEDKKLSYIYIDDMNIIRTQSSKNYITITGWTMIDMVFVPDALIDDYNPADAVCYERRIGSLIFYVNGRQFWKLDNFDEFFFHQLVNHKEKQQGVPYNISFGGGSFGLKHSWHYDNNTIDIYTGQSQSYIEDNFIVTNNPLNDDPCWSGSTGGSYNSLGLVLSADTTTFHTEDECDPTIDVPIPVMRIQETGGTTLNEYFIEFDVDIDTLSNRELKLEAEIYDTGIFKNVDHNGNQVYSEISLVAIADVEIEINKERVYGQPVSTLNPDEEAPFPTYDGQIYQYEDEETRLIIDGQTGYPAINEYNGVLLEDNSTADFVSVSGREEWQQLSTTFTLEDNSGAQTIRVGLLIQSTDTLNEDFTLYLKDFTFTGRENLVQDENKDNLLIQQNFDLSFIGGIQKLRLYTKAFNSQEVLHNAKIELKNNPGYAYKVSTGGRIIYR